MQDQIAKLVGEVRSALRFRWYGLGLAMILSLGGWAYVASMPNIYEARASFFLDTTSLLEQALENQIIETDSENQLAYIRQSLFGQAELESVARSVGLDAGIEGGASRERMLDSLRRNIVFESLTTELGQFSSDRIYELRYRNSDREVALSVVEALVNTFISGALGESRRDEDEALGNIEQQIQVWSAEANRAQEELADFKRENVDQLPGEQGEFQRRMRAAEQALTEARRALNSLQSRLLADQREIENLQRILPSTMAEDPDSLGARLRDYELEFDDLSLRFQPSHPDLIRLRSIIANLTQQIEAERQAALEAGADPNILALEANPVYQEALIARADTERLIAERLAEISDLNDEISRLEDQRDESLANEATQAELERAVADAREQVETLLASRRTLERTMAVETSGEERFRTIDEPYASSLPVEPDRISLLLVAFLAALGAGGILTYGCAQLRPIFSNARDLQDFAELPVLGTVTNAWPSSEQHVFRKSILIYSMAFGILIVAFIGLIGIEMYGPGIHAPFSGS